MSNTTYETTIRETSGIRTSPRRTYSPQMASLLLLFPAIGLCSVFIFIPAFLAVVGSLYEFSLTSPEWRFVGLGNYAQAMADPVFWLALRNNALIVIGSIVLQVGFGTVLAAILDRGLPAGSTIFRTIIFAPMVISSVAVALIWLIILDPNTGVLNALVKHVGLTPPILGWLGDPNIAMPMLLVIAAWQYTGFMMVLILAGLQGVPKELYEAAALDGAKGVKAFWHITLPSIRNVLVVAILITTIGGIKVFDLIYATTNGGPANATQVMGTYIYLQAFSLNNMGYADAMSVVLLVLAVLLGILQLKASRRA
ncbi:sugar ABC transporter permease [Rhizobium sp. BK251]|uniref:carbohydrate ABC transporter permease n=1 Tax=Rhizobium sp. BK251 TaxID=2512125 RepID=UPI0010E5D3BB|nr:sugar ABC transporter permease [Rhizobium sp. BK251]TCL64152.1 carbohydrate ABC transporter membrane protein 1 (CUT1 family) [Rhizobium sp. BK251]